MKIIQWKSILLFIIQQGLATRNQRKMALKFLGVAPTLGEKSVVLKEMKVSETAASHLTCLTSLHAPANLS